MQDRPTFTGIAAATIPPELLARLRTGLPEVAEVALGAVNDGVPEYAATLSNDMASNVQHAIEAALRTFLGLVERSSQGTDAAAPIAAARRGAYALGRGEARAGRTMEALLAAYRVGARISWREFAAVAVAHGTDAPTMASFAELVFAYIDELSGASVAGHTDELATSGRLQVLRRERLARALVAGEPADVVADRAEQAGWAPPARLTAVLLPAARLHDTLPQVDVRTLSVPGEVVGLDEELSVLLVPGGERERRDLLVQLAGRGAVVAPSRAWTEVASGVRLAVRARAVSRATDGRVVDVDDHLTAVVVSADAEAFAALRARALAPLADLKPATAARLAATLRSWLLHEGRRAEVAAALQVHPQTVRYRMDQVRDLYGDALERPAVVEELVVALALNADGGGRSSP